METFEDDVDWARRRAVKDMEKHLDKVLDEFENRLIDRIVAIVDAAIKQHMHEIHRTAWAPYEDPREVHNFQEDIFRG